MRVKGSGGGVTPTLLEITEKCGGLREMLSVGDEAGGSKGSSEKAGAGMRKEARGEARGAELPRARRPERANAEGGAANSSWEVARAIAKHRKSRSRAQHTFKVQTAGPASHSDWIRVARSSEPGGVCQP